MGFRYRLGLDLGTNSLGWCVIELNNDGQPTSIKDGGARIFSDGRDPKSKSSLAVNRRIVRGARRRRDRYIRRRTKILNLLTQLKLMPSDSEERQKVAQMDPYQLRYEGLDRPLLPYELGRVLFALNQRRGFLSNRKSEVTDEDKKSLEDLKELKRNMAAAGSRTLGEYLYKEQKLKKKPTRSRPGARLYPDREMYKREFDYLKEKQAPYHHLTGNQWDDLNTIIFFQRPLAPVDKGLCQLYYEKKLPRAYAALPSAQKYRALQDINNLKIVLPDSAKDWLNQAQKEDLYALFNKQKTVSFKSIKKVLKLQEEDMLNLEDARRDGKLYGVSSSCILRDEKYFGDKWDLFSDEEQDDIVNMLLDENEPDIIFEEARRYGVSDVQAEEISKISPQILSSGSSRGTSRFSEKALRDLIELMKEGLRSDEAIKEVEKKLGLDKKIEISRILPYYGYAIPEVITNTGAKRKAHDENKTGIIGNPTVHVGLNQLRKVVNAVISEYGSPAEIVLEMARDLKINAKQKEELRKKQLKETKDRKEFEDFLQTNNIRIDSYDRNNQLKYKLWKELLIDGVYQCPFTGEKIGPSLLFSPEVEVEHILPWSATLDDSASNKTVCLLKANRVKENKSPYEAFGRYPKEGYNYQDILERAKQLPKSKKWRFEKDAIERFSGERDFLARQLNDTRYLSKVAKKYLKNVCEKVWVSPGQLTAIVRRQWGLSTVLAELNNTVMSLEENQSKNRDDHRHHTIDAIAVALLDRGTLQDAAIANAQDKKIRFECPISKEVLRKQTLELMGKIMVSHRANHRKEGALHEGTNYGTFKPNPLDEWENNQFKAGYNVVYRKALTELTFEEVSVIRDAKVRNELLALLEGSTKRIKDEAKRKEMDEKTKIILSEYSQKTDIKKVRILKKESTAIPIHHPYQAPKHTKWVAPGDIHHVQFWQLPDGSVEGKGVSLFERNQPQKKDRRPHPASRLLMKLHKGDAIQLIHKGKLTVGVVKTLIPAGSQVKFWDITTAKPHPLLVGTFKFNAILSKEIKKIHINVIGKQRYIASSI
jgi:CRISPR-associated endonuclease Csn1